MFNLSLDTVAAMLHDTVSAEFLPSGDGTSAAYYFLHVSVDDLSLQQTSSASTVSFCARRDITPYEHDETPERVYETETLEDESFRNVCMDLISQASGYFARKGGE